MGSSKWMVDCKGSEGEAGGRAVKELLGDWNFAAFTEKQGSLAAAIRRGVEDRTGRPITESGGGGGFWHLGVGFDELSEAVAFLDWASRTFTRAVGAGLIRWELKTWCKTAWGGKGATAPDSDCAPQ